MRNKKTFFIGIGLLVAASVIFCIAFYENMHFNAHTNAYTNESLYKKLRKEVKKIESETQNQSEVIRIDFEVLNRVNEEIHAWLSVSGTTIDYPIVQSATDNNYYKTHTIDKKESIYGSLFTEDYNEIDFSDPHTIIYSFDATENSPFQDLYQYQDRDFFQKNREIIIYLPEKTLIYEIFAAYTDSSRHLLDGYDLNDERVFEKYLESILNVRTMTSNIDATVQLSASDRIITLSACSKEGENKRYVVQAVLRDVKNR